MKSSDAPSKQSVPFGVNGSRQSILDTTPTGSNAASYDVGFPPITMILKSAGGLPPLGQNLNEVLYELSGISRFLSAGGGYVYDSTFSTAVSGYPAGAVIPNSTLNGLWINTVDDNTTNPENNTAALTGWVPAFSYGNTNLSGITSSTTVSTLQASKDRIIISGSLTNSINIILPAWIKKWTIVNNCTGSASLTVKTPSGSGVIVPNQTQAEVYGDGTNINMSTPQLYSGRLLRRIVLPVGSGTYNRSPDCNAIKVSVTAGGGSGCGCSAANTNQTFAGSGGGAGASLISFISNPASSYAYTVGSGGAQQSGGQSGVSGGNSTFGSSLTCTGGGGGTKSGSSNTSGGVGGTATGGDSNFRGGDGGDGQAGSYMISGMGGASMYGGGGRMATGTTAYAGRAPGSGGGGAYDVGFTSVAYSGGAGADGTIIVEEYS